MAMRVCALILALLGNIFFSVGQPPFQGEALSKGYYIVVAAYRVGQEKYMLAYSEKLNKSGLHSKYGYDLSRNFYYVYLDFYSDFDESIREMLTTRKDAGFEKAWVRIMKDNPPTSAEVKEESQPVKEVTQAEKVVEEKKEQQILSPVKSEEEKQQIVSEKVEIQINGEEKKEVPPVTAAPILFYLYNPTNSQLIDGEVEIIDTERSVLLKKEKSNQLVSIPYPKTKSGKVSLIGTSFGFRKVQHDLSAQTLKDSLPDYVEWDKDHYVVRFDLARLHKGDIETLYNVYFFNDAAIMLPDSRYELNKLLDMLKSNPGYRIKLHGHTNGNGQGKITSMGPSKNFFELTPDVVTGYGSAKELSHQRAVAIKEWLVANQIASSRIETKAWGGSRMLHDRNSDKAHRNVRVEVEVLEE
jgi:outer membrane protein OmpA-like peptidoglycan-associated protein